MKTKYCKFEDRYYKYYNFLPKDDYPKWCKDEILLSVTDQLCGYYLIVDRQVRGCLCQATTLWLDLQSYILQDLETGVLTVRPLGQYGIDKIEKQDLPDNIKIILGIEILEKLEPCCFCKVHARHTVVCEGTEDQRFSVDCANNNCNIIVKTRWVSSYSEAAKLWNEQMKEAKK